MTPEETLEALDDFDGVEVIASIQHGGAPAPSALLEGMLELLPADTPAARVRVGDNLLVLRVRSAWWLADEALEIEADGLRLTVERTLL